MTAPAYANSYWPANFQGCTLTGTYVGLDGAPIVGTISLSARPTVLQDFAGFKTVVPRGLQIALDVNGSFSLVVPATDDPDVSPVDWTYYITENFPGGRTYDIEAPMGQTVDIVRAAPLSSSTGNPLVRGPQGISVLSATVTGGHLVLGLSDGSIVDAGGVGTDVVDGGTPDSNVTTGTVVLDGGTP